MPPEPDAPEPHPGDQAASWEDPAAARCPTCQDPADECLCGIYN